MTALQYAIKIQKNYFDKAGGPLIGSKLLVNYYAGYSMDQAYGGFVLAALIFMLLPAGIGKLMLVQSNMAAWAAGPISLLSLVYAVSAMLIFCLDLNAAECYIKGYDGSLYALATGVTKSELRNNKGLIGEYKSYVLSRSLKIPHKALYNVCVPMPNGSFQEIDAIIITPNIIYVMECKNRGGRIKGRIEDEKWSQHIGKQINEADNFYLQNQGHIAALNRFLLNQGLIQNGENMCMNTILSIGDMTLFLDEKPSNFVYGSLYKIKRYMEENGSCHENDIAADRMERIYEALLPYALYNSEERQSMMEERKRRFESAHHRTDQISKGVSDERVEAFKQKAAVPQQELVLKKLVYTIWGVTLALLVLLYVCR